MCFFSTSKAPAPPPGRRWLVLAPLANLHPSICVWALGTAYSWNITHMYNLQKTPKQHYSCSFGDLQKSDSPICSSLHTKGRLRFTGVWGRPSQIYVRYHAVIIFPN
jgi:hypothetical protein